MSSLANEPRRALVLGGSGRVGSAVCERLVAGGARVAFTFFRSEAAAAELVARLPGAIAIRADLSDERAIDGAVAQAADSLGGVDGLVHAVAHAEDPAGLRLARIDAAAFDRTIAVDLRSAFLAVRALVPHFAAAGRGEVVLLGSVDAVKPAPSAVHYVAAKAGLSGMAMALAKELGPAGVRVNVVAPGLLDGGAARMVPDAIRREYLKHCALKRTGRFAEVAELVAFLVLENSYISGQTICVDGGL